MALVVGDASSGRLEGDRGPGEASRGLARAASPDLLGRWEASVVRERSRRVVEGRRVLVTGAGGSIGTELCRQVRGFGPRALVALDHDDSNLHRMQLDLDGSALLDSDELVIADVRDAARIHQVFRDLRPEVVFHAAAHKHLPLLERHPCEGVKSNVMGTLHLADAAVTTGVQRFILLSTDKAADPTSVLGATQRLAEMIVRTRSGRGTRFAAVRFGNVLGSRGSFLPTLAEQIAMGVPVTVTHPDVARFVLTLEEAVGLVIEAARMAGSGDVFVLDVGEPVRILDLVRRYAALFHLDEADLDIRFTGLRPGEKLTETPFGAREARRATSHPRVWSTVAEDPDADFCRRLELLCHAAMGNCAAEVRRALARLVPGYAPGADLPAAGVPA